MTKDCIFCKIVKGEIPSCKIYEDSDTLAFLDIAPVNPGHTLVIPKEHFENLYTLPDETLAGLILTAKKIAQAIKKGIGADGVNIGMNNEKSGGQVIFHAHLHIIPRIEGDGLKLWPQKSYKEGEAESVAEKIKESL
ncbi:MAG TPA: HIT family protein [Candidatus Paceibacterota bacterium]